MLKGSKVQPRAVVEGQAIVVRGNDIDTDRIIPARFAREPTFAALGAGAFADDRSADARQGRVHPFDDPCYRQARIMFVNKGFGCGSSREHAIAALMRWQGGIQALVGESFAEIFFNNCLVNGVPAATVDALGIEKLMRAVQRRPLARFRLDLESMNITDAETVAVTFTMPASARARLVDGSWDTLASLLTAKPSIKAIASGIPYLNGFRRAPR